MINVLYAQKRNTKSSLRKLRNQGKLPAVLYGYNTESTPIVLEYTETAKAVQKQGKTSVFQIELEGKKLNTIINEVQRCALKGTVKHVDFLSINMNEELEVDVPIVPVGDSVGVNEGGVLTQPIREIKIKVKPADMPEQIEVDVSSLHVGDSLSVADIRGKIKFEIINADEDTLVSITPPATASDDTEGQSNEENEDIPATEAPESES